MTFETLVLFALSTVGMTHIIVDGSIMSWFRAAVKGAAARAGRPKLGGVVDCYLCAGTWCGFLMGLVWVSYNPFQVFACGCAGGFLANAAALALNWVEAMTLSSVQVVPDDVGGQPGV